MLDASSVTQWHSQDIANPRAGTAWAHNVNLYKICGLVQPPRSVLKPYRSAVYVTYMANSHVYSERTRLILWIYIVILCCSISRWFSA